MNLICIEISIRGLELYVGEDVGFELLRNSFAQYLYEIISGIGTLYY